MIFEALDDADQYGYRADVTDAENNAADDCEGTGLGGEIASTLPNSLGQSMVKLQSPA